MRILHTSDWHLGRTLEGRSRLPEQEEFLDILVALAGDEDIDLVLVAGDVFDSANPPAAAEELYYDALERLAGGGRRAVVVVAGNHDSPDRIRAANPLALKHGISLVGYPNETLPVGGPVDGVRRVASGPGWFEVVCPGSGETAVICALAYPSEARLKEVLEESLNDKAQQVAYSERVERLVSSAATAFHPGATSIVVGHLFALGGEESESERQIQLGGAFVVPPRVFGAGADYVALGHLHRPQSVMGSSIPCRYSGSPLAFSFSEADRQKEVVVVETSLGRPADARSVPLACGMPMKRWPVTSIEEALRLCSDPHNRKCWVEIELDCRQPPGAADLAALHRAHPGIVHIKMVGDHTTAWAGTVSLSGMTREEQFRLFCRRQMNDEPSAELVALFMELCGEGEVAGLEAHEPEV